ncbi:hypothetical protein [Sphingobacterium sp. FBM7-1]|uniref:hypothetical protein n=1 Tax=Sphingobacterium sp. FBM7-1 TaxID=2886688 RepID=UPI001D0FC7A7|nr:hypothetical protein [Sphingobacterium sp. FBM7-1]MCC2597857.1 hypothetical protein [Sphingobacterium sp. FBM7-1]
MLERLIIFAFLFTLGWIGSFAAIGSATSDTPDGPLVVDIVKYFLGLGLIALAFRVLIGRGSGNTVLKIFGLVALSNLGGLIFISDTVKIILGGIWILRFDLCQSFRSDDASCYGSKDAILV